MGMLERKTITLIWGESWVNLLWPLWFSHSGQHSLTFIKILNKLKLLCRGGPPEPGAPCHGIAGILVNPALYLGRAIWRMHYFSLSKWNIPVPVVGCRTLSLFWSSRVTVIVYCDGLIDYPEPPAETVFFPTERHKLTYLNVGRACRLTTINRSINAINQSIDRWSILNWASICTHLEAINCCEITRFIIVRSTLSWSHRSNC